MHLPDSCAKMMTIQHREEPMNSILNHCRELDLVEYPKGEVLLEEGDQANRILILSEGAIEVYRHEITITVATEPGAIFGEMSVLLGIPHTASVRTAAPSKLYIVDEAYKHVHENPTFLFPIARLLARRLKNSTDYLVDLKRQFADHKDHFGMVDEVLDSLIHQQDEDFIQERELPPDP
jgi:CRP/FNR family transcriptional regulator, cyclic AMP receptor protein